MALAAWIASQARRAWSSIAFWSRAGLGTALVLLAGLEAPYWPLPSVPLRPDESVVVLGDSLSAGVGTSDAETWPRLLARDHQLALENASFPGSNIPAALSRVPEIRARVLFVVELGGNDMLRDTPPETFERRLDSLLRRLQAPEARTLMFELPLIPGGNRYGAAQRRLAQLYGVTLIPRRVLARAVSADGFTTDGLHLSPEGHRWLAQTVWEILKP
jgi:acyl-CoA thioesterase I